MLIIHHDPSYLFRVRDIPCSCKVNSQLVLCYKTVFPKKVRLQSFLLDLLLMRNEKSGLDLLGNFSLRSFVMNYNQRFFQPRQSFLILFGGTRCEGKCRPTF